MRSSTKIDARMKNSERPENGKKFSEFILGIFFQIKEFPEFLILGSISAVVFNSDNVGL